MNGRLLISRLTSASTRTSAARGLAVACGAGFLATVIVLAARGHLEGWFFALLVWALFIYAPLRIVLEAAGTLAPALRQRLAAEAAGDAGRFPPAAGIELTVDRLLEREVVMPRIATPMQREKARDGVIAVLSALRAGARGGTADFPAVTAATLSCLQRWVAEIGPWAEREAGQNIQARWREVRALAALAAMTRVLVAAQAESQLGPDRAGPAVAEFLDACLDYCDDLALTVDVSLWDGPDLRAAAGAAQPDGTAGHALGLREAWRVYADTGPPALEARKAFVKLLLASPQPPRPTAS